ncbi:MAG: preprotein translocase subunit YajC [Alphaproteobacteria bacterium]
MFISPAYAQAGGAAGGGDMLVSFLPLILIFVVFWFFLIRPQQQKMKQHRALVAGLKRGDQVVTGGGLMGRVTKELDDSTVQVEIAEGVRVKVVRGTITDVVSKGGGAQAAADSSAGSEKKSLFSFGAKK